MSESEKVAKKISGRVTPGQTPDQQSKQIEKLVHEWAIGFSQDLQGQAINEFIREFLDYFSEETRKEIEEAIVTLHAVKDFDRFRRKMIGMVASVYANGVHDGREGTDFDYEKLGETASRKIHEQRKGVLKPLPGGR